MERYKYLFKNMGLLTLSSFATKLISFILVPLYTNILSTTEYGIYDFFNTTIGVLLPLITLNIQESVMRFSMEKKTNKKSVISIGIKYFFIGMVVFSCGLVINYFFEISSVIKDYAVCFWFMYMSQSLSGIVLSYARGADYIADLSLSSVGATIIVITCNILFLVVFKWGLLGYFWANIIGPLVQSLYIMIRTDIFNSLRSVKVLCKKDEKGMLNYCRPMIANSIAWWVNNSSDRYVIIFFCGLAENGIYSVASKIPSILNIFQSIFAQAWALSAVRDFDAKDEMGFFSNTYKAYNCFMVIMCSGIIVLNKILAKFLFAKEFYMAWKYVPWLSIAIVFGALSGYIGGFFSAVKNSKIFAQSSIIGAIVNILLNLIFTPIMGALGAAIATTICYFVTWVVRFYHSKRFIKLNINLKRDYLSYGVLVAQAIYWLNCESTILTYAVQIVLFGLIILLYSREIFQNIKKITINLKDKILLNK